MAKRKNAIYLIYHSIVKSANVLMHSYPSFYVRYSKTERSRVKCGITMLSAMMVLAATAHVTVPRVVPLVIVMVAAMDTIPGTIIILGITIPGTVTAGINLGIIHTGIWGNDGPNIVLTL